MPGLLERKVRILVPLLPSRGREGALLAAELASEIEWAKARMVKTDGYERAVATAGRTTPRPPAEVAAVYRDYEREKRKRGLVDFDDLISGCADVLERDTEFAAAQRWRFRHLFVDEFQDASAAQFRLLRGVARRPQRPLRGRRPRPGDLRLRRRRRVVPGRLPPLVPSRAVPRRRVRPPRQQLPIDAAGGRGRRRGARSAGTASRSARRPARRAPARVPRVRHRRGRSEGRRTGTARCRECASLVVAHGRPLPRQRAVGALRGGLLPRGRALPRPRRRPVPRPSRGEGRARPAPRLRPHHPGPAVRGAPHRFRDRRREPRRGAPRARRRARYGWGTSSSRPTAAVGA